MIKGVVLHFNGRLPLLVDLHGLPGPQDQSLLATNVRTRDGKRPSFAEATDSWFLFPIRELMVMELPTGVLEAGHEASEPLPARLAGAPDLRSLPPAPDAREPEADTSPLEPDEDLLARIRDL
jgi:hypothetical protein